MTRGPFALPLLCAVLLAAAVISMLSFHVAASEQSCGVASITDDEARRSEYLRLVDEICKDVEPKHSFYKHSRYLVNTDHKVIIAVNPKVMSTSSKLLLASLDGVANLTRPDNELVTYLADPKFTPEQVTEMLGTFNRLLFIRHPLSRLYSAWGDKFKENAEKCREDHGRCPAGTKMWVDIARGVLKYHHLPNNGSSLEVLEQCTWQRFVEAVAARRVFDRHWREQVAETHLCSFRPTFVGALEHSSVDLPAALVSMGKDPSILHSTKSGNVGEKKHLDYATLFPEHLHRKLQSLYRVDYTAFGYSPSLSCILH